MSSYAKIVRLTALSGLLALPMGAFALQMTKPPMDAQQLTHAADEVVIGNVVDEETTVVERRFETRYTVRVDQNLKSRSGQAGAGQQITLTLPGGALTTPPLTQYVTGVPYMAKGEDVVLFLREPQQPRGTRSARASAGSLNSSYRVVGWNQGRFSVLKDPNSGEQVVARLNLEDYGLMNTGSDVRRILDAIHDRELPLVRRSLLQEPGGVVETRERDPLEVTGRDQQKITANERQRQAKNLQQTRERKGIPVQSLSSFTDQIRQFAD